MQKVSLSHFLILQTIKNPLSKKIQNLRHKLCDSNFDVNIFQISKVATNESTTLH